MVKSNSLLLFYKEIWDVARFVVILPFIERMSTCQGKCEKWPKNWALWLA